MVKQRMTSLDVRATVEEMRNKLVGLRLLNLYDLNPTMFEFKFGHGENKHSILLESGVRFHLTELVREKPRIPSQFTLKIRKHVRAWRLDSITQLQHDRTIDMCFGVASSAGCFHIIVELFSKGNIILTDHNYTIMMLLRTHKDADVKLAVHNTYPVTTPLELENRESKMMYSTGNTINNNIVNNSNSDVSTNLDSNLHAKAAEKVKATNENEIDKIAALREEWLSIFHRQPEYETTRSTLSAIRHFGNSLADHILTKTHTKSVKKKDMKVSPEELFTQMLPGILEAWHLARAPLPAGGYLITNSVEYGNNLNYTRSQKLNSKCESESNEAITDNVNENMMSERAQRRRAKKALLQKEEQQQQQHHQQQLEEESAQQTKTQEKIIDDNKTEAHIAPWKNKMKSDVSAAGTIDESLRNLTRKDDAKDNLNVNHTHEETGTSIETISKDDKTEQGNQSANSHKTEENVNLTECVKHYDDFSPILLAQYTLPNVCTTFYASFGKVCDAFFLPTETEKITQHNTTSQQKALSKREKFERDHARRISALEREQELNQRKGEMIICNASIIDEAIGLINGALATGLQWEALHSVLKRRHAEGHPVAYIIHDLFLERNSISVLLETDLYDDEDDKDVEAMVVEVELNKTAHANATMYFSKMKANQAKLSKTLAATEKAAAGAARKGDKAAAKQKTKKQIVKIRNKRWWEKFRWFRTSAGDLVLQGKDAQSTDFLLRRFMCLHDVFIFTDVDHALPCLLRPMNNEVWHITSAKTSKMEYYNDNSNSNAASVICQDSNLAVTGELEMNAIALISVEEAGGFCVSMSGAWENKQTVGAWWIYASQLTGGSVNGIFTFDGNRHHILPQPLALGCGLLFEVSRDIRQVENILHTVNEGDKEDVQDNLNNKDKKSSFELDDIVRNATITKRMKDDFTLIIEEMCNALSDEHRYIVGDRATILHELPVEKNNKSSYNNYNKENKSSGSSSNNNNNNTFANDKSKSNYTVNAENYSVLSCYPSSVKKETKHDKKEMRNAKAKEDNEEIQNKSNQSLSATSSSTLHNTTTTNNSISNSIGNNSNNNSNKELTNRQKRKLKKIKEKYHDQDDEDRLLGARLNGNELSKVQLQELQELQRLEIDNSNNSSSNNNNNNKNKNKNKKKITKQSNASTYQLMSTDTHTEEHKSKFIKEIKENDRNDNNNIVNNGNDNNDNNDNDSFETVSAHSKNSVEDEITEQVNNEEDHKSITLTDDLDNATIHKKIKHESCVSLSSHCDVSSEHNSNNNNNNKNTEEISEVVICEAEAVEDNNKSISTKSVSTMSDTELKETFHFFTSTTQSSDNIRHVYCVCAPFRALVNYPFRVELAAGNIKKGQAAHAIIDYFKQVASSASLEGNKGNATNKTSEQKTSKKSSEMNTFMKTTTITTKKMAVSDESTNDESVNEVIKSNSVSNVVNNFSVNVKEALIKVEIDDVIEQLRGNAKPLKLRV